MDIQQRMDPENPCVCVCVCVCVCIAKVLGKKVELSPT